MKRLPTSGLRAHGSKKERVCLAALCSALLTVGPAYAEAAQSPDQTQSRTEQGTPATDTPLTLRTESVETRVDDAGITFDRRTIPWPSSISPQAVEALKRAAQQPQRANPELSDVEGWRKHIAENNAVMARFSKPASPDIQVEEDRLAGVRIYRARPHSLPSSDKRLYIDIHGGALIYGAGAFTRASSATSAKDLGVEVVAVDYRVPPDHPFPAALDDCFAVYAAEVEKRGADNIIVGGGSAGGNLAAALMLRLKQAGLPMPAALVLMSPEADLTESGDSFETNLGLDANLPSRLTDSIALYANGHALTDPLVSPLFGDLSGFPPTYLQSGTRDLFLSNTVRMHRQLLKAGVDAQLHVFEAMPHGAFMGAPEDEEALEQMKHFVAAHWPSPTQAND